jgi:hypothetical protein
LGKRITAREKQVSRAAAEPATWYQRTFHGRADQVSQIRREIAVHLGDCPAADDLVLIVSELAGNAVLHSQSQGEFFAVRCQAYPGCGSRCKTSAAPGAPARPTTAPTG